MSQFGRDWRQVRPAITAADSDTTKLGGVSGGFYFREDDVGLVNFIFTGGTTTATVKVYVWSNQANDWILSDEAGWTLTGSLASSFNARGRRCNFYVSALGAGTTLNIEAQNGPPRTLDGGA